MCRCPAHEDDKSSLKIDDKQGGGLLVKCFAGCDQGEVIDAMKAIGAWPDTKATRSPPPASNTSKPAKKKLGRIVSEYSYVSAEGELLFQALRYEPKDFRQRKPKPGGGWAYNLKDVQLVPFQLPELISAIENGRYVFVVEGEKDCLAMRDRIQGGVVATCCPMGAGKWRPEYNKYFAGAGVLVLPDNDAPGRKHADQVATQLRTVTEDVRIIELPGLPEHGDVTDWLDAGGTREELLALIKAAMSGPFRPLSDETKQPRVPTQLPPSKVRDNVRPDLHIVGGKDNTARKPEPRPSAESYRSIWAQLDLTLSGNGMPICNLDNAVKVIENRDELKDRIRYDEFYDRVRSNWRNENKWYDWRDRDTQMLSLYMQRVIGLQKISSNLIHEAVMTAAFRNHKNEPLEWMNSLEWDGTPRLRELMPVGFGTKQNDYTEAVGRCWMVGMAARVFDPGCKLDNMPVFEGSQGNFKSTALEIIGGDWHCECHEPVTSKDFYQILQGRLLVEISELHAFKRAEVERIKGIITCRVDRYRKSYGRLVEDHPRTSVFSGTTNQDDWNADDTGARRFWPISCGTIDLDWIREHRTQLFAEAVERYKDGEPWWNVPDELAKKEQELRRVVDEWERVLLMYIDHEPERDPLSKGAPRDWRQRLSPIEEITVAEFLEHALEIPPARWSRGDQMRASSIFKKLKWQRVRKGGQWVYRPPSDANTRTTS